MATRIALKAKEAFLQYSKKMCTRVTIFWMIYRMAITILIFFKPDISNAMIHLTDGVDTVMIVNMSVYTANSSTEKIALAWVNRSKKKDDEDDENDEENEEEENNS